ncbi:MAG: protein kinase, partial [Planctomycetes bacterium]|nr:protein kinase [Planctomycetota bacterium]
MSDSVRQLKITPDTVEGYSLTQRLGEGTTGTVFKAKRLSDGGIFAIKLIFPALAKKPDFEEKFVRLAQLSAKIDHPNIVKTHASGVSNGFHYVVMEFVEGKTLESVLARGAMDEQRALQIVQSIARALVHVQQAGVLHRDIKPANILLPRGGEARLTDLGLAQMATNPKVVGGGVTGTPHYMSPEAARAEANIDIRSDVYSLGATLYHMLTGQTMFTYGNVAEIVAGHLSEKAKPASKVNSNVSSGASRLVQKLTEKKPADRPWPVEAAVYVEAVLRGEKPFETASRRTTAAKSGETEVAIHVSKDSPTPLIHMPALDIPIPGRVTTAFEETITAGASPVGKGSPGRAPAGVPPGPKPGQAPPAPGHRVPSTSQPTPPAYPAPGLPSHPQYPQAAPPGRSPQGYPSPYPPSPAYPPPQPGQPYPGPPPQGYPPQGYPPQG